MKNKSIINRLLICLSIIVLCSISILWLFETSNHLYYLLTLCGLVIISIGIAIWYLQKDSQPILIDLTNTSSKVLQNLFLATIILLSIYVIPFDYFIISALLIIASMIVPAFFQKSFSKMSKEENRKK